MTTRYIWRPDDVNPLCHGLWPNIVRQSWREPVTAATTYIHAHRCIGCDRRLVCTCLTRGKYHLLTCLWCGLPWTMTWRAVPQLAKAKRKGRRKARAQV